jgi:hypothetical protein
MASTTDDVEWIPIGVRCRFFQELAPNERHMSLSHYPKHACFSFKRHLFTFCSLGLVIALWRSSAFLKVSRMSPFARLIKWILTSNETLVVVSLVGFYGLVSLLRYSKYGCFQQVSYILQRSDTNGKPQSIQMGSVLQSSCILICILL